MLWFWIGFFTLIALLLFLDLGVLHRKASEPTFANALGWTVAWVCVGLSFAGVVYLMYENHWLGIKLVVDGKLQSGGDAAIVYLSAYLLEQALSIDNIFVISLLFRSFRVPNKYQHRVLFWGILGAIVFRVIMLAGGAFLAKRFDWIFYLFGGYLAWQGAKLLFGKEDDEEGSVDKSFAVRALRRVVRIVDGDHGGKFLVTIDGRKALTTVAVCLVVVELTDVVFALDSIPAVLSVSQETFIMVTSNIFAIMGLRSLYFVLAGAMAKFKYLKIALAVLLILIGVKMVLHGHVHISHVASLAMIAGIIGGGVLASIFFGKDEEEAGEPERSATNEAENEAKNHAKTPGAGQ
jgi:tellurite resistance protein TerC